MSDTENIYEQLTLDDILKKALTPQNEIREEEILVQNRKREGKTMRRKRAKKF